FSQAACVTVTCLWQDQRCWLPPSPLPFCHGLRASGLISRLPASFSRSLRVVALRVIEIFGREARAPDLGMGRTPDGHRHHRQGRQYMRPTHKGGDAAPSDAGKLQGLLAAIGYLTILEYPDPTAPHEQGAQPRDKQGEANVQHVPEQGDAADTPEIMTGKVFDQLDPLGPGPELPAQYHRCRDSQADRDQPYTLPEAVLLSVLHPSHPHGLRQSETKLRRSTDKCRYCGTDAQHSQPDDDLSTHLLRPGNALP